MSEDQAPENSTSGDYGRNARTGRNKHHRNTTSHPSSTKFVGRIPEMQGHIYDCVPHHQVDQYSETTSFLADYFVLHHSNAGVFRNAIHTLTLPEVPPIPKPVAAADGEEPLDECGVFKYGEALKEHNRKVHDIEQLNMTLYFVVWSQCSSAMRARLECLADFATIDAQSDGIALLRAIKSIVCNCTDITYKVDSMNEALVNLLLCRQTKSMSTYDYYQRFKTRRDVYEFVGGSRVASPGTLAMVAAETGIQVHELTEEQQLAAREMELAALFIQNADKSRHYELQIYLKNKFLVGDDRNPKNLSEALSLLVNWIPSTNTTTTMAE